MAGRTVDDVAILLLERRLQPEPLRERTTVNDRHLYQGPIVVQDPSDPSGRTELPGRIVRFGPAGWLTVMADRTEDAEIELHPVGRVLAVTDLREAGVPGHHRGAGRRAPAASCAVVGAGHQRRGSVSRDCAVRHARQFPQVTMASGVVAEPHSGHSTASCDRVRASVISRDRSSWILSSPRQGHPRWASAQRPRCVVMEPPPSVPTLLPGIGREGCEAGPVAGQRPERADPEDHPVGARQDGERAAAEPGGGALALRWCLSALRRHRAVVTGSERTRDRRAVRPVTRGARRRATVSRPSRTHHRR